MFNVEKYTYGNRQHILFFQSNTVAMFFETLAITGLMSLDHRSVRHSVENSAENSQT